MPHLTLLVVYTAIATFVNLFDLVWSSRVIKETTDNYFFIVALVTDGATILYMLIGLIAVVWLIYGMPVEDKNSFVLVSYVVVGILFLAEGAVTVGLEMEIRSNPGEFIDQTWLLELVMLGYKTLKWVIVLSYALALAELADTITSQPTPAAKSYELVPQQQPHEEQSAVPRMMWAVPAYTN